MPTTPAKIEAQLESKRGGLFLGLVGLTMGFAAWEANRRRAAHQVARTIARGGRVPDLRLYTFGTRLRAPFRETLGGNVPDLRDFALWSDDA